MRTTFLFAVALIGLAWPSQMPPRAEPFVPAGVWYGGGEAARRDLRTIKSRGFNTVWTPIEWRSAELERGTYRLDALDQLLTHADEVGLRVAIQVHTDVMPVWLGATYPDAALVNDEGVAANPATAGVCLDHDGVRSALAAFTTAVVQMSSRHRSVYAFDVWRDPHIVKPVAGAAGEYCFCAHTQGRFRQWLKSRYVLLDSLDATWKKRHANWNEVEAPRRRSASAGGAAVADWRAFIAAKLRDDLAFKADAAKADGRFLTASHADMPSTLTSPTSRFGNPDDWLMRGAVDHYGTALYPKLSAIAAMTPGQAALTLDGIRSATADRGWWLARLQADPPATAADLRLWGWTAIARGARAIAFDSWSSLQDGERAKTAGEFAGIIARNPALFAPLRPRASRVGILYDAPSSDVTRQSIADFHGALFEQNIQADFVHTGVASEQALWAYDALFVPNGFPVTDVAAVALRAYVARGGALVVDTRVNLAVPASRFGKGRAIRLTGGPLPRIADVTGVQPEVRLSGGGGLVEAGFLESRDALVLIALNHSNEPQRTTLVFPAGTKQQFWQNMETGEMVTFASDRAGITLTHTFAPRDALVLTIRKTSPYDRQP